MSDDDKHHAPDPSPEVPCFAGMPTFLRLPYRPDLGGAQVAICGAPFDGGTTCRPGARFGPRAVREASALTCGHSSAGAFDGFEALSMVDAGDVPCVPMDLNRSLDAIEARTQEVVGASALPVFVGGDHSISLGVLRGLCASHGPLGLVHFDAHGDTVGPASGVDLHHGTVFRAAMEEGLLRPRDVVQIGIRGPFTAADDLRYAQDHGFRVIPIDEVKQDLPATLRHLEALAETGKFYVSFDMDFLDPAYAPGTGTPVPGGATTYEAQRLLRALRGVELSGFDVVEISPDHDHSGNTALVAATVLTELLAVFAGQARRAAQ